MPTGYTAGVVDGTTKTFKDYALICMRNFGACMHLRDTSFSEPYTPRIVSSICAQNVIDAENKFNAIKHASDKEIIDIATKKLQSDIDICKRSIKKQKAVIGRLQKIRKSALSYTPATKDHKEVKEFMINQLEMTIESEIKPEYYEGMIKMFETELKSLDVNKLRVEMITEALDKLTDAVRNQKDEADGVKRANKWVEDFVKSLK